MPAQALYLKWRPRTFDDVIGQGHITRTLRNALIQDRVRHAYLFNGPRGTGKTTMARILAKAVNCLHPDPALRPCDECQNCVAINENRFLDLIEIDAASHNGVDDVRELRDGIAFSPSEGRYKVYIIDEVHRFSGAAFDALLKTLEEPPDHAIFVLATTELDKVPATIKSRSLTFEFRRVSLREVADRLELIATSEGIQIDRAVLELAAMQGTGSVRDSISLLDQLIVDPGEQITMELAEQVMGTVGNRLVGKLVEALIHNDGAEGLNLLNQAIEEGADPSQFGRQIVGYLRNLMLLQTAGPSLLEVTSDQIVILQEQAKQISRNALIRAVRAFNTAIGELRSGWQPQLPLELAVIESTRPIQAEELPPIARPAAQASAHPATQTAAPAIVSNTTPDPALPETLEVAVISLAEMRQAWPHILQSVNERHKPLSALLRHAAVKSMEGVTLTLAVDPENAFVKQKLEAQDKYTELVKIIYLITRAKIKLRVMVTDHAASSAVNDTIVDDPLVSYLTDEHNSTITNIEDTQGGV